MIDQEVLDSQMKADRFPFPSKGDIALGARNANYTLGPVMLTTTTITTEHVDLISSKPFEKTVKDLTAELGKASTEKLMDRLSASDSWDAYAAECADFAGRSNLIEVGYLNWGKVLTLSGKAMKARCYIVGNPLTPQKLLAAGGPAVGPKADRMPCREMSRSANHV